MQHSNVVFTSDEALELILFYWEVDFLWTAVGRASNLRLLLESVTQTTLLSAWVLCFYLALVISIEVRGIPFSNFCQCVLLDFSDKVFVPHKFESTFSERSCCDNLSYFIPDLNHRCHHHHLSNVKWKRQIFKLFSACYICSLEEFQPSWKFARS